MKSSYRRYIFPTYKNKIGNFRFEKAKLLADITTPDTPPFAAANPFSKRLHKKNRSISPDNPNPRDFYIPPNYNLNPKKIKSYLDGVVIGQEDLKRTLSVALFNHYQRLEINKKKDCDCFIEKSNILIHGPSGSGKTLAAKTIAKLLNVPFTMNDATSFTQSGYVGDDVESCISRLLQACDYDVEQAERGIVFIDEIDKIGRKSDPSNPNQKDVGGEGVQQGLLRMLEGTNVHVSVKPGTILGSRLAQPGETISIDTSNILFICSGAFIGLENIISERINRKSSIGFNSLPLGDKVPVENSALFAEPEDFIKYGFLTEFIGRLPIFAKTVALTVDELAQVLTEPRNALLKQYQKLFEQSKIELAFPQDTIQLIAETAKQNNTGARGLRRILESILEPEMYEHLNCAKESRKLELKADLVTSRIRVYNL